MKLSHQPSPRQSGFSMMEVLTVVAIMGVLAAVAIPVFDRFLNTSEVTVAGNLVEVLNDGVKQYLQMEGDDILSVAASAESSQEELDVLRALQWSDSSEVGSLAPYVRSDYDPEVSSSTDDYRAVWNGSFFELVERGSAGAGLKISFDGSDYGTQVSFGDGFVPLADY